MYSKISLKETVNTAGLKQVDIKSLNGLSYTIIDNLPDNSKTYLKLSYLDEIIFEFSIDKFNEKSVFDTEYFKSTQHHYLFRMDKKSLKLFLDETERCISVPFSNHYEHYLYIDNEQHQLEFSSPRLNLTSDMDYNNTGKPTKKQKWVYTYSKVKDSAIHRIVNNYSVVRYTVGNYKRSSDHKHYFIVGDHFQLFGVFNGYFQHLFAIRYSPKTLELHLHSFNDGYSYLTNQSFEDLQSIFKSEFFNWLEADGDSVIKLSLNNYDFSNMSLDDSLKLLEMAII